MRDLHKQIERKDQKNKEELSFNIDNNALIFESVINNILSLVTSMRNDRSNSNYLLVCLGVF